MGCVIRGSKSSCLYYNFWRARRSNQVKLPVTVQVDNVGAIIMSKNISTLNRTKHVDIRTQFVNEYVEDGIIKIIFVQSNNNDYDIMTKNVNDDLLNKHAGKLITNKFKL